MLTVKAARDVVLEHCRKLKSMQTPTEMVSLPRSQGRVLSESIYLDLDQPPFNRSMRDGFAVIAQDLSLLPTHLSCVGEIKAGESPALRLQRGEAIRIMTGAPAPEGADAVVMVEHTEKGEIEEIIVHKSIKSGSNIAPKGSERQAGDLLISKNTALGALELGVLATVGKSQVRVFKRPSVSILTTGNELVDVGEQPGPGKIRNSNAYSLHAQVAQQGGDPQLLGPAEDHIDDLRDWISIGLKSDLLLVSGGVSVGKYDLVESVFEELGIQLQFESVSMRPGKPTVFGKKDNKFIFGLPGNPVSTFVSFELFVTPVLRVLQGLSEDCHSLVKGRLKRGIHDKSGRTSFLPALVTCEGGCIEIEPLPWKGSADIFSMVGANGLVVVPLETDELFPSQEAHALLFEVMPSFTDCGF